jgi:hypothetical protein
MSRVVRIVDSAWGSGARRSGTVIGLKILAAKEQFLQPGWWCFYGDGLSQNGSDRWLSAQRSGRVDGGTRRRMQLRDSPAVLDGSRLFENPSGPNEKRFAMLVRGLSDSLRKTGYHRRWTFDSPGYKRQG